MSAFDFTLKRFQALNAINRADLLHDAFLLAETDLNYFIVMNLTSYLVKENAYQPWVVTVEWFNQMNRLLAGTPLLKRFQVMWRKNIYIEIKLQS